MPNTSRRSGLYIAVGVWWLAFAIVVWGGWVGNAVVLTEGERFIAVLVLVALSQMSFLRNDVTNQKIEP